MACVNDLYTSFSCFVCHLSFFLLLAHVGIRFDSIRCSMEEFSGLLLCAILKFVACLTGEGKGKGKGKTKLEVGSERIYIYTRLRHEYTQLKIFFDQSYLWEKKKKGKEKR